MFFDIFTILPLTCAIFVTLLGLFVLFKNPRSRMNQLLFALNVTMFFWLFGTFMMFATRGSVKDAIFWDRFVYLGVVMMPSLMHHFSLVFTDNRSKTQKIILVFNYLIGVFFLFASRTKYFVDGLYVYSWGAHTRAQFLHSVFLGYFFLGTGVFFRNLIIYYRRIKTKLQKIQTIYVFVAFGLVMFVGGSAYLFAYGIDIKFPFAYITGLIFPILLFYAVSRHNLLGKKVIGTEVLVGVADFFIVMQIFFARTVSEIFIRAVFAALLFPVGYLLVQSLKKEIDRRQEITNLAASLEQANIRLQELDKQKTEFISIASHQLRTPLSVFKGYLELIKDGGYGQVDKRVVEVLNKMDANNEHLIKLIDEFLDITRIEQGRTKYELAPHDICAIVDGAVAELSAMAKQSKLSLKWICPKEEKIVSCDAEKIRHVIFNFIDNAIKYSTKGVIKISTQEEGDGVSVRVKDPGLGFNKVDEANFFQKFYRGENVRGTNVNGTGLGLYVCRKFVEAHGGRVWAHSDGLGEGSEFGLWVPFKPHVKTSLPVAVE